MNLSLDADSGSHLRSAILRVLSRWRLCCLTVLCLRLQRGIVGDVVLENLQVKGGEAFLFDEGLHFPQCKGFK